MSWKILVSAPYAMPVLDHYRARLENAGCELVVPPVTERLSEEDLFSLIQDIDGMICGDDQISERVMAAAPRLKVISKWGTGIDSIDVAAAERRGIVVCNTPNAFSEPVADTVLGYTLVFARKLHHMNDAIHRGTWIKPQLVSLNETTLGVVGVGNCGKAVVRRAVAFGMRVLGNDLVEMPAEFLTTTGIEMLPLDDVLAQADFVSINASLNPSSFHLIDKQRLARMKSTAYLVNTARGAVLDEDALAQALTTDQIAGAALDVFETEPLPADSPLRSCGNCWLAPHNANSSPLAAQRVHDNTIRNLLEGLRSQQRDPS